MVAAASQVAAGENLETMIGSATMPQTAGLDPALIDDAVAAVRGTGYRAAEARAAVAAAASRVGANATLEALIYAPFQQLYGERRSA